MTAQEIIEKLKALGEVQEFAYGDFPEEFGPTETVFEKGGEDEGSDWRRVYHFQDHNVYLQFAGWYSSYNGTDFYEGWECCTAVLPKEQTITVYE